MKLVHYSSPRKTKVFDSHKGVTMIEMSGTYLMPAVPLALQYSADWIYDIDKKTYDKHRYLATNETDPLGDAELMLYTLSAKTL